MNQVLKIAIADDEVEMRDFYVCMLRALGHEVIAVAETGRQLIAYCRERRPDLIITDIMMPEMNGDEAAAEICREDPIPVILVSARLDSEMIAKSENDHVMAYLAKPISRKDLEPTITLAMRRFEEFRQLHREAAGLEQALANRKIIDHAKRLIMKSVDVDETEAFRRLQTLASDKNQKLINLAQVIIAVSRVGPPHRIDSNRD